jgi:hypothetical protein
MISLDLKRSGLRVSHPGRAARRAEHAERWERSSKRNRSRASGSWAHGRAWMGDWGLAGGGRTALHSTAPVPVTLERCVYNKPNCNLSLFLNLTVSHESVTAHVTRDTRAARQGFSIEIPFRLPCADARSVISHGPIRPGPDFALSRLSLEADRIERAHAHVPGPQSVRAARVE